MIMILEITRRFNVSFEIYTKNPTYDNRINSIIVAGFLKYEGIRNVRMISTLLFFLIRIVDIFYRKLGIILLDKY